MDFVSSNNSIDLKSHHNGSLDQSQVNEVLYDVPVGIIVLLSIFYGSISIMGVVGNSLVIWIVGTTKQMQTVTNLFIANLAFADVIISVFAIPFQFQAALLQRWNLPDFMCPLSPFMQLVSVNVSVFTLTAIAVDRHRAILNPLKTRPSKHVCKAIIGAVWFISIILSIPIIIALQVIMVYDYSIGDIDFQKPFCAIENLSFEQMLVYRYILVFVQYVIPLSVISFVYIQMAVRLWGSKTPGNAEDARDINLLKNKKRVIKMLVIVVAIFGLCWLPLQTYNILQVTWDSINEYRYINIIFFCCDWLAMSNSCYNPFIYGIYNEKFKREFKKRFPFCRSRNDHSSEYGDKTVSMHTRCSSIRSSYTMSTTRKSGTNIICNNSNNIEQYPTINKNYNESMYSIGIKKPIKEQQQIHSGSTKLSTNCDIITKKCNKCQPNILYQQVNTSPKSSNKKVLYKLIDTEMSSNCNKCSCQKIKENPKKTVRKSNDLNYNNNEQGIGFYQGVVAMKPSPKQTYVYKSDNQKRFGETDTDIYILLKIESNDNENKENDDKRTSDFFKDINL